MQGNGFVKRGVAGALLMGTALATMGLSFPAMAQQAETRTAATQNRSFRIGPQSLQNALTIFGQQAGVQVSADSATLRGFSSAGVSGLLTPQAAIERLLAGTGLNYRFTSPGTVLVSKPGVAAGNVAADGSTVLGTIVIAGRGDRAAHSGSGYQGTPDWVYETPAAVSVISREAIQNAPTRNARDLLDNVAGVMANRSEGANPGISVNIRGLQDQGRVVTMIDGARQSFQRNGHGSSQRAYVDTAFLRSVEIDKGGVSGVGGAGALGGIVNFRTIVADDLIRSGRNWGVEVNGGTGTNAFRFDGSAAAAFRTSDGFSILAGVSHKNVGEYKVGRNGKLQLSSGSHSGGAIVSTGQKTVTTLLKAEGELTDTTKASLTWLRHDSDFMHGGYDANGVRDQDIEKVVNNSLVADFAWNPDSDLVDLKTKLWWNNTINKEERGATLITPFVVPVDYEMNGLGFSLENTSQFHMGAETALLNYGVEAFRERGKTETLVETLFSDGFPASESYTGMTPGGRRDVASVFANATWEHDDWLIASGGLRYDHYRLDGTVDIYSPARRDIVLVPRPPRCPLPQFPTLCFDDGYDSIEGPWERDHVRADIDRSKGALLPSAMIAVKPFDWLQPFVKYSRSFRPPTTMEAFIHGGHPGVNVSAFAPNPSLLAEEGDNYEIGANILHDGVFFPHDNLRLKLVGFYKEIDNYISIGKVRWPQINRDYNSFVNLDGTTRIRGIELEAAYDAERWYLGGSFTWMKTDIAGSYMYNGTRREAEPGVIFIPPEFKLTLDAGVRLFDEDLTLGGRVTHVGGTEPTTGLLVASYDTEDYTVVDLYGSWAVNDTAKLNFSVKNVGDVAYVPALGTEGFPAPGRTFTTSLSFKF